MSTTLGSDALPEADSSLPQVLQHQHREQQQQQQPWLDGDKRFKASSSIRFSDCNNNNNNGPQRPSSSSSSSVYDDRAKVSSQLMTQQQQQELQQPDSPFYMELRKKQYRNPAEERRPTRPLVQQMSRPLKRWLRRHGRTPYPTIGDKRELARQANMTVTQVSNWFANARRRLKNTVRDPSLSWSMRIKAYNRFAAGKQELMSSDSSEEEDDVVDDDYDDDERTGRIPSPDSCCRSQDSVGQENDNDAVPSRNCHRVRCTPSATGDHKLSSLSDCTETDGDDDDDESDCIREMRRVRCPGNLAEDETSREAALNFDDDAAHQIRRDGKTKGGAPTSNHRSEFIEMCSRKRKKLRRSHPTNIKSTRNSLPHGREEELEGAGKMELWTLEEIYSEMLRTRENSSQTNSSTEDLYWMEIGAAIALTRMARSCHHRQNQSSSSLSLSSSSSSSSSSSFGSVGMPRKWNLDIV